MDLFWDKMWSQMRVELNRVSAQTTKKKIQTVPHVLSNIEKMRKQLAIKNN